MTEQEDHFEIPQKTLKEFVFNDSRYEGLYLGTAYRRLEFEFIEENKCYVKTSLGRILIEQPYGDKYFYAKLNGFVKSKRGTAPAIIATIVGYHMKHIKSFIYTF